MATLPQVMMKRFGTTWIARATRLVSSTTPWQTNILVFARRAITGLLPGRWVGLKISKEAWEKEHVRNIYRVGSAGPLVFVEPIFDSKTMNVSRCQYPTVSQWTTFHLLYWFCGSS